jgi:small subunit ribosomal protein S1
MTVNLMRDLATEPGNCFLAIPYGVKRVGAGGEFDADAFHGKNTVQVVQECGMTAHRADSIYGPTGVLDAVWRGIQKAEIVIVDFTGRTANVLLEFAWALMLGKRIIVVTQDASDIPSDITGLYRYIKYSEKWDEVEGMKEELRRQLDALRQEPAEEKMLTAMVGGTTPAPGDVIAPLAEEFVTIRTLDGRLATLSNAEVDYTRVIKHMTRRFSVGERVNGAFVTDAKGSRYTLLAGQTNPWPQLAAEYPPGSHVTAEVQNIVDGSGAFVRIGHGVNGRVPQAQLAACPHLRRGSRVEVLVTKIDSDRRQIDLQLIRALDVPHPAGPPDLPPIGTLAWAEVQVIKKSQAGAGYLLLKLPGHDRLGLLHRTAMSDELGQEFDADQIERGDEIFIEVTSTDTVQNSVRLADRPAPEDRPDTTPAAA